MCMAPAAPAAPAVRNVLQVYGRTLDLDKPADRRDYETLQRREAAGLIDRWGRELAPPDPEPAAAREPGPPPQAGSAAQKAEPPRPADENAQRARRRTASQARVAGRSPAVAAGSRLGRGNSAKATLLGG